MSEEQQRDEQGRFLASLPTSQQARAAETQRIREGLDKIAENLEKAKANQQQQLTPEQERMIHGEFLRVLLTGGEDTEE